MRGRNSCHFPPEALLLTRHIPSARPPSLPRPPMAAAPAPASLDETRRRLILARALIQDERIIHFDPPVPNEQQCLEMSDRLGVTPTAKKELELKASKSFALLKTSKVALLQSIDEYQELAKVHVKNVKTACLTAALLRTKTKQARIAKKKAEEVKEEERVKRAKARLAASERRSTVNAKYATFTGEDEKEDQDVPMEPAAPSSSAPPTTSSAPVVSVPRPQSIEENLEDLSVGERNDRLTFTN